MPFAVCHNPFRKPLIRIRSEIGLGFRIEYVFPLPASVDPRRRNVKWPLW